MNFCSTDKVLLLLLITMLRSKVIVFWEVSGVHHHHTHMHCEICPESNEALPHKEHDNLC